jgi:nucleotide-binding universal stress UspA family protein
MIADAGDIEAEIERKQEMSHELSSDGQLHNGGNRNLSNAGGVGPRPVAEQPGLSITDGPLLVGVDWPQGSQHALHWVGHLAQVMNSSVVMLHAISPWVGAEMSMPPFDYDQYRETVREEVDAWAKKFPSVDHESKVVEDDPVRALLNEASLINPALIAVGAHPTGKWVPHMLGSVASKLLHEARTPVAVVPETAPTTLGRSIVVGVDGSPSSVGALRWTARSAMKLEVSVQAVCSDPLDAYAERPRLADPEGQISIGDTASALRELAMKVSRETGANVNGYVLIGDPAERLITLGQDSYALVLGKNGHSPMAEAVFGSTSREVATHSKVPVIVVP